MIQKLIKIGDSVGVTIPKKQLQELDVAIGDEIEVIITKKISKPIEHAQLLEDLDGFMKTYDQDLKSLANR
jgi:antitoxin component of MazEF toxin-antitoxin module